MMSDWGTENGYKIYAESFKDRRFEANLGRKKGQEAEQVRRSWLG
jgi:hypothetical protein